MWNKQKKIRHFLQKNMVFIGKVSKYGQKGVTLLAKTSSTINNIH